MNCSGCGKEISDAAKFCPYCGKSAINEKETKKRPAKGAPVISVILVAVSLLLVFMVPFLGILISAIGIVYGIVVIRKIEKKKWMGVGIAACVCALLVNCSAILFAGSDKPADRSVDAQVRKTVYTESATEPEQETEPDDNTDSQLNGDLDAFTIMVYIIGSNLESGGGLATTDIVEMANAVYGEDVNVVIQTGGAKAWMNSIVPADKIGRFELRDGYLMTVEELPQTSMCRESTLTEFIKWGASAYPSGRYGLILWDHGGGVLGGYGADENYPSDNLSIPDIAAAIGSADVHFDFIGFDACLMGSLECAYSLKESADYMIASEESEAGTGWYYTDWLTYLGQNPDASMEEIGRKIVDGLVEANEADLYWGAEANKTATLSLIDLHKIDNAYLAWKKFMGMNYEKMKEGGFNSLSTARANARCYGDVPDNGTHFEMVDMLDYVNECALPGTYDITQDIRSCIIYTNSNISGSNGLSVYLPYYLPELFDRLSVPILQSIGFDDDYFTYLDAFCAALASGNSSIEYDGSLEEDISVPEITIPELMAFENIDGQTAISFSEDQVDTIVKIEIEAGFVVVEEEDHTFIATHGVGAKYVDLTEDGKLIADNSQVQVPIFSSDYGDEHYSSLFFYRGAYDYGTYEDGTEYQIQYSPAILNGDQPIGILTFIYEDSYGTYYYIVQGYVKEDGNQYADRGLYQFREGDVIVPRVNGYICEEDPFTPIMTVGTDASSLVVGEDGLKCEYFPGYDVTYGEMTDAAKDIVDTFFKDNKYVYRYVITDIYQNRHYTEWLYY